MIIKESHRQEQAAETKKKLYESAMRLFIEHGYDEVSVDDIVAAAGVSKGTFYVHYESKDALIAFILSDYVRSVDADYQAHLDSLPAGTTACDMLLSLIEKIADVLTDTIGYEKMRIVYRLHLSGADIKDAVTGYNRQLYKMFTDVIGQGIAQEEFSSELTLDALTKHFVMAIRGLSYEWCIRYPDFDLKEHALVHFKILLSGIRKTL